MTLFEVGEPTRLSKIYQSFYNLAGVFFHKYATCNAQIAIPPGGPQAPGVRSNAKLSVSSLGGERRYGL